MIKKRKILLLLLITGLISFLFLTACSNEDHKTMSENVESMEGTEEADKEPVEIIPSQEIVIAAVGDIMVHGPQLRAQYNAEDNQYDFRNNFQFIEAYLKEVDLAIANLETTFGGEERGYSSFPLFNTPDALAGALKEGGFHIIATANNHTIDTGSEGMFRTIEVLEGAGLEVIGTRKDIKDDNFMIKTIKGIHIGLTAYTYETQRAGRYKTLNGIRIPTEIEKNINSFSYEHLEEDLIKIKETILEMKKQGAEIIIFYLHWGEEYQRKPNSYQKYMAQQLSNYGVDIIFGSHPHVIQPIEIIESETDHRRTLVVYSLGNFLSNQRYEILQNRYTEDGMIVNVKVKKDFEKDAITIKEVSYIPTWVYRYYPQGKPIYEIIPVLDVLNKIEDYHIKDQHTIWRMENSRNNTIGLIEANKTDLEDIPIYVESKD